MPKSTIIGGSTLSSPIQFLFPGFVLPWDQDRDFRRLSDPGVRNSFGAELMPDTPLCSIEDLRMIESLMGLGPSVIGTHQAVGWFFLDLYETLAPGSAHAFRTIALPHGVCMHRAFSRSVHATVVSRLRAILDTASDFSDYESLRRHHGLVRVYDPLRRV